MIGYITLVGAIGHCLSFYCDTSVHPQPSCIMGRTQSQFRPIELERYPKFSDLVYNGHALAYFASPFRAVLMCRTPDLRTPLSRPAQNAHQ